MRRRVLVLALSVPLCLSFAPAIADTAPDAEAAILDEKTPADEAARLTREALKLDARQRHAHAVAANTRGLRLFKAGQCDAALPLFEAAAALDKGYGMPRYNAARCLAQRGDVAAVVRYLEELKALGKPQLGRLAQAEKDEGFARVAQAPAFKAVFSSLAIGSVNELESAPLYRSDTPLPSGLWRALARPGATWKLARVSQKSSGSFDRITVAVQDTRRVAGVEVVRLAYSHQRGKEVSDFGGEYLPAQLAITDKGVYTFSHRDEDAAIRTALKKKPAISDPPELMKANSRKDGYFAFVPVGRPATVCYGWGAFKPAPDEPGCGANPCCSWMCLDATGVVAVGGTDEESTRFGAPTPIPCE